MTELKCPISPAVIAKDFEMLADVLTRYDVVRNTLLRAANDGHFPKPWRIKGNLYFRKLDLTAHDAMIAAAVAAPTPDALA